MTPLLRFALTLLLAAPAAAQPPIEVEELPAPAEGAPAEPAAPGAVPAPPAPPADPLQALEFEAQNAYADGDVARALALYLELGEKHPEPAERARVRIRAAWLAWQQQDFAGAVQHLERALFDKPDAPFRADLYAPEFVAAHQDALAAALARRRQVAAEAVNEAAAALAGGRTAEARRRLGTALALTPDDPEAVYNLALVDLREGREDAALAGFERVLALERGNPEGISAALKSQSLNNSAVIYFGRGEYPDAERALHEAVALVPEDAQAWLNLGLTRQRLGRPHEGYEALRRARALAPRDVAVARALALAEVERGGWVAAVALLVEATQARPDDPDLRLQLGRAQRGLGNDTGAIDSFRKAIDLDPRGEAGVAPTAVQLLADLLRSQGDVAGAVDAAERAVALQPADANAWLRLGLARYEKGDLAPALEALRKADALEPGRADVAHNTGTVRMAMRDYEGAETSFRAALERDPSNAGTRAALAQLEARRKEIARAALARGELGASVAIADYAPLKIRGLRVDDVPPGSVAARIGLLRGDLILRVDGKTVETLDELRRRLVGKKNPPLLDVLRAGAPLQIRVRID
jgi:tetratricopeptide (TPR) repeat protein